MKSHNYKNNNNDNDRSSNISLVCALKTRSCNWKMSDWMQPFPNTAKGIDDGCCCCCYMSNCWKKESWNNELRTQLRWYLIGIELVRFWLFRSVRICVSVVFSIEVQSKQMFDELWQPKDIFTMMKFFFPHLLCALIGAICIDNKWIAGLSTTIALLHLPFRSFIRVLLSFGVFSLWAQIFKFSCRFCVHTNTWNELHSYWRFIEWNPLLIIIMIYRNRKRFLIDDHSRSNFFHHTLICCQK